MDEEEIKIQPESDAVYDKREMEDEVQFSASVKSSKKSLVRKSSSDKSRLSLKPSSKSKLSSKSRSVVNSQSNKVLLTKSLDSVKALLASKETSTGNLKDADSIKKTNRTTSIGMFLKNRRNKAKKSKRCKEMKESFLKLNADTIRKIARELIRKKGCSLLNVRTFRGTRRRSYKKKKKN